MKKRLCPRKTAALGRALSIAMLFLMALWAIPVSAASGGAQEQIPVASDGVPRMARLVLSDYRLEEGDEATSYVLHLALANKGSDDAYNILLTFEAENGKLLPAYGTSNQVHIPHIATQDSATCEIPLVSEGAVESFLLNFYIQYLNPRYSAQDNFFIGSFTGKPTDPLQLLEMELTGAPDAEGRVPVRVVAQNRTDQPMSNVQLQVYSPLTDTTQIVELGTLEAGDILDETYFVQLANSRIQQVQAFLSYEDGAGDTHAMQERLFSLYHYASSTSRSPGGLAGYLETLRPYAVEIVAHLVLIAIIVLLLVFLLLRRRRSRTARVSRKYRERNGDVP